MRCARAAPGRPPAVALAARRGLNGLRERRPFNVVVAAVANKPARILWAMLSRGEADRAAA